MDTTMTRTLGRSELKVSAIGFGCWAIGGEWIFEDKPAGWGNIDQEEATRAIQRALELGITFFDTADVYGCGQSERILGRALGSRREQVVIATKFGLLFDEETRQGAGHSASPTYIRSACEASLKRLGTDYIDIYQLHGGVSSQAEAEEIIATLEDLVREGKIRFYGPSADDLNTAQFFAHGPHCTVIQQQLNIFGGNDELLKFCEAQKLAVICRTPLAMGLLTGKYQNEQQALSPNDVRLHTPWWEYFKAGQMQAWLTKVEAVRSVLTAEGRTLAQGALAWIWARSNVAVPVPGFKTTAQVEENAAALHFGPLSSQQMHEIEMILRPEQQ
jgi:aryl-alcohol dehydrogenase-like predicted oxidoreductase